jgi:hypothetical protein
MANKLAMEIKWRSQANCVPNTTVLRAAYGWVTVFLPPHYYTLFIAILDGVRTLQAVNDLVIPGCSAL